MIYCSCSVGTVHSGRCNTGRSLRLLLRCEPLHIRQECVILLQRCDCRLASEARHTSGLGSVEAHSPACRVVPLMGLQRRSVGLFSSLERLLACLLTFKLEQEPWSASSRAGSGGLPPPAAFPFLPGASLASEPGQEALCRPVILIQPAGSNCGHFLLTNTNAQEHPHIHKPGGGGGGGGGLS